MRTAQEIDAAKVLNTTDLAAVTSEVRQFPPGYVTGGRLKLNTNLQIEVAPIAVNVAGRDVRISDTTIIGNEHWVVNGVETPRVPGSWYYLYLNSAAVFAVSPVEPAYNNLYFAYYHPEVSDLRAIGKFYFGNKLDYINLITGQSVLYVQSGLELVPAQVLIAASTYSGEDANYYCDGILDDLLIITAARYLIQAHGGGTIHFSPGTFYVKECYYFNGSIFLIGNISTIIRGANNSQGSFGLFHWGGIDGFGIEGFSFENVYLYIAEASGLTNAKIINNRIKSGSFTLISTINHSIIANNYCYQATISGPSYGPFSIYGNHNIIYGNSIVDSGGKNESNFTTNISALYISGERNQLFNNIAKDNGNLIDRSTCERSSTSPMIFGEVAPTASNCTWGFTSTGPYEGTGQYRFSKTAAAGTRAYLHLVDNVGAADVHGLIPGTQYEWSGWFKASSSGSAGYQGPRIYQVTTGGGASSATAVTVATASWQWVAVTATIYVNATTAYIGFWASSSLGNTHLFDVDNLRLFPPGTTNVHNQNFYDGGTDTYTGL